jgi:hypothetical protein
MRQLCLSVSSFANRALSSVTNKFHLKALSVCLLNLSLADKESVPHAVLQATAHKLSAQEAGMLLSPAQKQ